MVLLGSLKINACVIACAATTELRSAWPVRKRYVRRFRDRWSAFRPPYFGRETFIKKDPQKALFFGLDKTALSRVKQL